MYTVIKNREKNTGKSMNVSGESFDKKAKLKVNGQLTSRTSYKLTLKKFK